MIRHFTLLAVITLLAPAFPASAAPGRTVQVKVTEGGWVPDRIEARKGEPLTLVITRETDKTCATEIVVKEYGINTRLPLGKTVTVKLTPNKAGQVKFTCGMDMISGTIVVQ
jgi:plastocyanin domain-containing protein